MVNSQVKSTNNLIKEQISVSKISNEALMKFIEAHCSKTNDKLDLIDNKIIKINENIMHFKNKELEAIYKRKQNNE